jgi:glycosyltransferase involved in cell wall biosynthesis
VVGKEINEFKEKYSLKEKKLVGFSGRFVEEKGVDYLLRAIPSVLKKEPKAHFVFAGDYKIKYEKFWERIKGLIEGNKGSLTLLGLVKDPKEIFAFYKSLSVYVQPSRTDCFPSSLVEALLAGVPCVCTDIPGARWSVKETGMGEIVKPGDPEGLAIGILKVLGGQKKYLQNSKSVREIFDYERTLKEYERLFRED